MEEKDKMIRIRCKEKTKEEFKDFTHQKKFKNEEMSLLFLMDYYQKTKHLTRGEVY